MWFGFLAIGQRDFRTQSRGQGRFLIVHGQVVKEQNCPVKDLDPDP